MTLTTAIKAIQDLMRQDAGVNGDAQRIEQLVWMLFLKIFDDREREIEDEAEFSGGTYESPLPERLRWRNWAADPEGITGDELLDFVDNDLFKTLKELQPSGDSELDIRQGVIRDVFEDTHNFMKNGTLIRRVINKVNEVDFTKSDDRHMLGDAYEKILRDLQSAGNAGEYYTPRAVTQFMTDMVDPKLGEKILDPACGTGGFLACSIDHVRDNYVKSAEHEAQLRESIMGVEKKPLPHVLCVTNMFLHGIDTPSQIRHDNMLERPYRDYGPKDRVDVILTNPPFGGREEDGIEQNVPGAFQTKETADLFLFLIMHLLDQKKDNARAALVLPDGSLFGDGVKAKLKKKLLEEWNLHTIVRLPKGVFAPYTSIKTNLLFFENGGPTEEVWFYEHPYPPGYKSYSKTKPIRIEEFDAEKAWWDDREENEYAWKVPVSDIIDNNYNLDISNPNAPEETYRDPDKLLAEYRQLDTQVADTRAALKKALSDALSKTVLHDQGGAQ